MRRRSFLLGCLACLAGVARILAGRPGVGRAGEAASPAALHGRYHRAIRRKLPTLSIADSEIADFLSAYEKTGRRLSASPPARDIATQFLLSSDFFQNGEDPSRPVRFAAIFDPYANPCYDPMRGLGSGLAASGIRPTAAGEGGNGW